jgi:hypothetical protein
MQITVPSISLAKFISDEWNAGGLPCGVDL